MAVGSSSDSRPAAASVAITAATSDFVSEPNPNRVAAVTASPVPASATPWHAVSDAPSQRTPAAAPGTGCRAACRRRASASRPRPPAPAQSRPTGASQRGGAGAGSVFG